MWFTYSQNNSFGFFTNDPERGIGQYVVIEAKTPTEADTRAELIGLYFDGCETNIDCSCCGDRWGHTYNGTKKPELYGEPVDKSDTWGNSDIFVHPLRGKFRKVKPKPKTKKG